LWPTAASVEGLGCASMHSGCQDSESESDGSESAGVKARLEPEMFKLFGAQESTWHSSPASALYCQCHSVLCCAIASATVCCAVPLVLQVKCCACDVGMAVVSDPEAARNATEAPSLLCALCDGMLDGDVEFNTLASILASCPTTLCVLPSTM
jgi:hypothetical protein